MYVGRASSAGFSEATKPLEISVSFGIAALQSEAPAASMVRNASLGTASLPEFSR
jgi:predicted AlkP superfamily pyrophosphatase or phosphodiesterase